MHGVAPAIWPGYGAGVRSLAVWDARQETAFEGFQTDHLMAASVAAQPDHALLRTWTRPQPALSVGRFHRLDVSGAGMERRSSGGRILPVGPGILGMTLVVPSNAWLGAGAQLRPEQVLNRALRPALAVLRELGVDAFYPGRDVVTAGGRPLLYASFCVFADDVVMVEQLLATQSSFAGLERLYARLDPAGVAGGDRAAFDAAVALCELAGVPDRELLLERVAAAAAQCFVCDVRRLNEAPAALLTGVRADRAAYAGFLAERGPLAPGHRSAVAISKLGAVEASARIDQSRLHDVEISGDLIAPFHTVDEIQHACEGQLVPGDGVQAAVARVLQDPRNFVLGGVDFAELLTRLV